MKNFFNDVLNEVELRYGDKVTLTDSKELSIFREVLLEYEKGILGRNIEKAKRRLARVKPKADVVDDVVEVVDLMKQIYSDVELYSNSKDSLLLIEEGYRKGAIYNAPGNIGSAFNETLSNEGVMILNHHELTLNQLALVLYYRTVNSELGKQQKDTPRMGIEIPNEIPRVTQNLYISSYLAAKSSMAKFNRSCVGTKKLQDTLGFEMESRTVFGGSVGDLETLTENIISAHNCYIYDNDLDKIVSIPRLQMMKWAKSAGSGKNSGDTVVLVTDVDGNILYDGWSDKKTLDDIQSNGTLNDDFTKMLSRVSKLFESSMIDNSQLKLANEIITRYQSNVAIKEEEYKNAALGEARYIQLLSNQQKNIIALWMDMQESWYRKNGTENHIHTARTKDGFENETNRKYLEYLITDGVTKSANRAKVVNRIALMERAWLSRNKQVIPDTLDTKGIVSITRNAVMDIHSEVLSKLNTIPVNKNPLGKLLSFYDTIDFLHINKIEVPSSPTDYIQFLKRNTNLIMQGISITPDVIKTSLGMTDIQNYINDFKFDSVERIMYDNKNKYVTGKVIQYYTISPTGERKNIANKTYRSKQGFAGKTSNTIKWSSDIQKLFKNY